MQYGENALTLMKQFKLCMGPSTSELLRYAKQFLPQDDNSSKAEEDSPTSFARPLQKRQGAGHPGVRMTSLMKTIGGLSDTPRNSAPPQLRPSFFRRLDRPSDTRLRDTSHTWRSGFPDRSGLPGLLENFYRHDVPQIFWHRTRY